MGDITNVGESERKRRRLGSDSKERVALVGSDEEEQIPSIFSWHHPSAVIGGDSQGPSGKARNVEGKRCFESELKETKHKIFLSHSGQEKSFVEQLCVNLEKKGYFFPFFDQRSHSLPKGKEFGPLILEAAKSCHVAVIVLSETFMTSKWPMIELVTFYEAQKGENRGLKLMLLFYKLSMDDLKDESNIERWMRKWREYESADSERINANKWSEAVKRLVGLNGFIFEQSETQKSTKTSTGVIYRSEVEYREAVEREILKMSPPNFMFGSSKTVVGFGRLCEMLSRQFVEVTATGVSLLGMYGMPGLGKTTMLEALCDYFLRELGIRVCYIDLIDSSNTQVERQKVVLKKLCEYEHEALRDLHNVKEGWNLMKEYLERDGKQRRFPVVLAIDNVTVDSQNEARAYLEAGFGPGSRIMVASRSKEIVKELLREERFCKPVPGLTKEEAETIILKTAVPRTNPSTLTDAQKRVLELCVERCRFSRDWGEYLYDREKQYHPFALKALADSMWRSRQPLSVWEKSLEDVDSVTGLFDILEKQFIILDGAKQLLFLDVALYGEEWVTSALNPRKAWVHCIEDWVYWLAGLHMDEEGSVKKNLEQLERSGMIKLPKVTMHQLYKEFAVWFVSRETPLSKNLARERTRIFDFKGLRIPRIRVRQWESLVLLQLISCTELKELNLDRLDCLRHLELRELKCLETLVLPSENDSMRFMWLSGLDSLKDLDIGSWCTRLQVIVIRSCSSLREPLKIEGCSKLMILSTDLHLYPLRDIRLAKAIGELLHDLYLSSFPGRGSGVGDKLYPEDFAVRHELNLEVLRFCSQLQRLTLADLFASSVQGLEQVTSLNQLSLVMCQLTEAPKISRHTVVDIEQIATLRAVVWYCDEFCHQLRKLTDDAESFVREFSPCPVKRLTPLGSDPDCLCRPRQLRVVRGICGDLDSSYLLYSGFPDVVRSFPPVSSGFPGVVRSFPPVSSGFPGVVRSFPPVSRPCHFCGCEHHGSWQRDPDMPRHFHGVYRYGRVQCPIVGCDYNM